MRTSKRSTTSPPGCTDTACSTSGPARDECPRHGRGDPRGRRARSCRPEVRTRRPGDPASVVASPALIAREARLAGRARARRDRAFGVGCPPDRIAGRVSATVDVTRHAVSHSAGTFWIPFAFVAVLACLWALASPLFSVPDENAHATKAIAQVRGELVGAAEAGKKYLVVDLPPGYHYNHSAMCYLFVPTKSAHCAASFGDGTGTAYFENWVGAYNPIYYYLVGWPSLLTDNGAVGRLRDADRKRTPRRAAAGLGVPGGAVVDPGALASVRASPRRRPHGALSRRFGEPERRRDRGGCRPVGIPAASARAARRPAGSRLEQPADLVPVAHRDRVVDPARERAVRRTRSGWSSSSPPASRSRASARPKAFFTRGRNYLWIGAIAAGTLFAGVWTLATNGVGAQAGTADAPLVGKGFFSGFAAMIRFTPDFLQQQLGVFGWLDTPLPWILYAAISIAIGVLVVLALTGTDRRSAIVVAFGAGRDHPDPRGRPGTDDRPHRPDLAGPVRAVPVSRHSTAGRLDALGAGRRTARVPLGPRRAGSGWRWPARSASSRSSP